MLCNTPHGDVKTPYTMKTQPGKTYHRSKYSTMQQELGSWPANTPELNLIEKVWGWMEMKLNKEKPIYAAPALIARVNELWDEFPMSFLHNMCLSYEEKLWALIESDGDQICGRVGPHV